ncbi:MAG TPA: PP2C family protein-serine/threonine phosphatase [Spirochaetota bacterium]|nr:PP2C family protein-serine/threonine phosphatase [Spirochaetota bacterium]HPV39808.1 PP2C family protein-serine/threonine phosphatase [Spirochaetota bacterium]
MFPDDFEEKFKDDYFQKSIGTIRAALLVALILYAAFGILDFFISPLSLFKVWIVRYAVVCPVIMLVFASTYLPVFKKINQLVVCIAVLTVGFGIISIIILTGDSVTRVYYFAGLMLVFAWSYTLARLRLRNAAAVCWTLVAAYSASELIWHHGPWAQDFINNLISNNFFFVSANILGMMANYYIEAYSRKDFLQRLLIATKQQKIEEEWKELLDRNETMTTELNMTRIIQQQLVPREAPVSGIYSLYRPMEAVGGDFYDFIRFREPHKIGIFISDVSGHGMPSALITAMMKVLILESSRLKNDPAKLLHHLNDFLNDKTGENYITAFYGVYDYHTRKITYANAGHHLPLVVSDKTVRTLKAVTALPLAVFRSAEMTKFHHPLRNQRDVLPANAKLLLYTDGLIEARSISRPKVEFSSVLDRVVLKYAKKPSREFVQSIFAELVKFRECETFKDDICMICLETSPGRRQKE